MDFRFAISWDCRQCPASGSTNESNAGVALHSMQVHVEGTGHDLEFHGRAYDALPDAAQAQRNVDERRPT